MYALRIRYVCDCVSDLHRDLSLARLLSIGGNGALDLREVHSLGVAEDGHDESSSRGDCHGDVDEVVVDDVSVLDVGVDLGVLEQRLGRRLDERGHEAELRAVLLQELVLVLVADLENSNNTGNQTGHTCRA